MTVPGMPTTTPRAMPTRRCRSDAQEGNTERHQATPQKTGVADKHPEKAKYPVRNHVVMEEPRHIWAVPVQPVRARARPFPRLPHSCAQLVGPLLLPLRDLLEFVRFCSQLLHGLACGAAFDRSFESAYLSFELLHTPRVAIPLVAQRRSVRPPSHHVRTVELPP